MRAAEGSHNLFSFYRSPATPWPPWPQLQRRPQTLPQTRTQSRRDGGCRHGCSARRGLQVVRARHQAGKLLLLSLARRSAKLLEAGAAAGTAAVEKELRSVDALAAKCGMQSRTATWSARRASYTARWEDHAHCL